MALDEIAASPAGPDAMQVMLGEAQLILAEKRTALAVMRTGIGVIALPLAVLSLLIASSRYYAAAEVLHLFVPVLAFCGALLILGAYLVLRAVGRIHHYDRVLAELRRSHPDLRRYLG